MICQCSDYLFNPPQVSGIFFSARIAHSRFIPFEYLSCKARIPRMPLGPRGTLALTSCCAGIAMWYAYYSTNERKEVNFPPDCHLIFLLTPNLLMSTRSLRRCEWESFEIRRECRPRRATWSRRNRSDSGRINILTQIDS